MFRVVRQEENLQWQDWGKRSRCKSKLYWMVKYELYNIIGHKLFTRKKREGKRFFFFFFFFLRGKGVGGGGGGVCVCVQIFSLCQQQNWKEKKNKLNVFAFNTVCWLLFPSFIWGSMVWLSVLISRVFVSCVIWLQCFLKIVFCL